MDKDIYKGIKQGIGFLTVLALAFGIVYAVGFHSANEIIGGIFQGNYSFNGSISGVGLESVQIFNTSGTWTKPSGVTYIKVTVVGGGGSGGSHITSSTNDRWAGGGGGGGTSIKYLDVTNITSVPIIIGTGGITVTNSAGNFGGTSSFGTYANATGGGGGGSINGVDSGGSGGLGYGGEINIKGEGGEASTGSDYDPIGNGGSSYLGGGGRIVNGGSENGGNFGGGGSGSEYNVASGAGANGVVIVEEYY